MIEKSLVLDRSVDSAGLENLRFYLPYVCEWVLALEIVAGDRPEVRYSCADEKHCAGIEAMALALLDSQAGASLNLRPAFDNRAAACVCLHDILPELLRDDHLIAFGPGQYGMGNLFLKTFKYFERECYRMASLQKPEEFVYPNLIARDLMEHPDYTGPHGSGLTLFSPDATTEMPQHLGKPAVCLHCYPHFRQRTLAQNLTLTTQGRCYRYEGLEQFAPDRLWEFIMRESVYMGTAVFVRDSLREMESLTCEWMKNLGLRAWVQPADDPLSAPDPALEMLGEIPLKWELRIALPATGTSLAAASFNYHADRYSKPFAIAEKGRCAATGCAGFGIERLTWGFLSQYGLDTKNWPQAVRQEI